MKCRGFTLLELMVVVAIVGILASIAYPNYRDYVRKANHSDGLVALQQLQLAQEKLRANCRFYGDEVAAANACGTTAALTDVEYPTGTGNSPEGWYTVTVTASSASGNGYIATAVGVGDQANDTDGSTNCGTLTLTVSPSKPRGEVTPLVCSGN